MTHRSSRLVCLALAAPLALSACADFDFMNPKKKVAPPCPPIYILSDVAKVTKFRPGSGRDLTDVELEAEIIAFKGDCSYDDKGGEVVMRLSFDVNRGPASTSPNAELTYFIAIPKFYPAPEAKAVFTIPVVFPEGMNQARTTDDDVVLRLPVKNKEIINDYEIYLGFQVSPEDLEAMRRSKR
ncbi:hypothetical protein CU669_04095 [Paramagnetospirillum kuznetsovii]|uniref:Lipoprotein n=2 Tax=Paramagnetospirillum kuznetsovii TaxID=2053833 RepID=A0A364P2M0_9PROT|nr:hypothetical protein CU669_04095 [Paramagnetospirillum kuznetsovii]